MTGAANRSDLVAEAALREQATTFGVMVEEWGIAVDKEHKREKTEQRPMFPGMKTQGPFVFWTWNQPKTIREESP